MHAGCPPFHRRSIRLVGYDYTTPGAYFVTMVTCLRKCIFGTVVDGEIRLNEFGLLVEQAWNWLPSQYPYINNEIYIVMPDHFHGILQIIEPDDLCTGGSDDLCTGGSRPARTTHIKPLGQLIGAFKTRSAKLINLSRNTPGLPIWQRNYYEHIIRNQSELESIAAYILANPQHWTSDPEYIP